MEKDKSNNYTNTQKNKYSLVKTKFSVLISNTLKLFSKLKYSKKLSKISVDHNLDDCIENNQNYERFFMPSVYEKDMEWAKIMDTAANQGLKLLISNPECDIYDIIRVVVKTARPMLIEKTKSMSSDNPKIHNLTNHAENFGIFREH